MDIVIGTHAIAGKDVRFKRSGLLIIDEEQRFGTAIKQKLRAFAEGVHVLALSATPIPRTLQGAMVGLHSLSLLETPPARRLSIQTVVSPFEAAMVRQALLAEQRRGGQSFLVCPRIEDIEPMAARLRDIVPELDVRVVHGKMPAVDIDEVMVAFADGEGDVLLATNIIESGLDLPRANTMLVWRPDRFGAAQLHQLRGRVGRGRRRGLAYLLTDPAGKIAAATEKRLRLLTELDRLGAGFAISRRDMDMRGAGDLLGEAQAGHVRLIGIELYRDLLDRALVEAQGGNAAEDTAIDLNLDVMGSITADYVSDPEIRINLYARLARLCDERQIDDFAEEIEDRFGPLPPAVAILLDLARLREMARRFGIVRVDAGPRAIAMTFEPAAARALAQTHRQGRRQGAAGIGRRTGSSPTSRARLATASRRYSSSSKSSRNCCGKERHNPASRSVSATFSERIAGMNAPTTLPCCEPMRRSRLREGLPFPLGATWTGLGSILRCFQPTRQKLALSV